MRRSLYRHFNKWIGPLIIFGLLFSFQINASTNINAVPTNEHWAWNDVVGWMDFYNTNSVTLTSQRLQGYASSSAGDVSFDCATTRIGNICGTSDYYVTNDGLGNLSGWGWNDTYGWVSFCGGQETSDCPGSTVYRVLVDTNTGTFSQYAWNDAVGWISFNCSDPGLCGVSNYKVVSSWIATSTFGTLDSLTYDTRAVSGTQLNSVIWKGSLPAGTNVRFQFAVSNSSSGPWNYMGTDGTSNTYYTPTGANVPLKLDYSLHNGMRYFRYRIFLVSNQAQTTSPRVDDVIINWSP